MRIGLVVVPFGLDTGVTSSFSGELATGRLLYETLSLVIFQDG